MTRRRILISLASLVAVWGATQVVKGSVSDQNGKKLTGAVVFLTDPRSLRIRSYLTGKNGAYQFRGLSMDIEYELSARFHGISSSARSLSRFDSGKMIVIDLVVDVKR